MVAQVGDPGTIAVSGREVDSIRSRQHLFQIPILIGKGLPQVKVDTALVCSQLCQLLVHRAQDIGRKADKNRKLYNGMIRTYFYQFMGPKPPKKKDRV